MTSYALRPPCLPMAQAWLWRDTDRGASCLGSHLGLKMQKDRFRPTYSKKHRSVSQAVKLGRELTAS